MPENVFFIVMNANIFFLLSKNKKLIDIYQDVLMRS